MKKFLRWSGIALGVVVLLVAAGVAGVYAASSKAINERMEIAGRPVQIPVDSATVARGEHIARSFGGCTACHGDDLAGKPFFADPAMGSLNASNLTAGKGGIATSYGDADWERAIRHGVGPAGRQLIFMPSWDYQYMADDDVAAVIAYIKTRPPVDKEWTTPSIGPVGRALLLAGKMPLLPAKIVDHARVQPATMPADSTAQYGEYIAKLACAGCHGQTLAGGPFGEPGAPPAANLTPKGIGHYTFESFSTAITTGVRPDGSKLNPAMPVPMTKELTMTEQKALWAYLRRLPSKELGDRGA